MWRALCLLLFALPAWAAPFATADIWSAEVAACDYEDTTTGETARVPVVVDTQRGQAPDYRVCKFDISHWLPGSSHAARMRSVLVGGGFSEWTAATLGRPASAQIALQLVPGAAAPPPPPPPPPSTTMPSYNSKGTNNTSTGTSLTVPYTAVASGAFLLVSMYIDGATLTNLTNNGGFTVIQDQHINQGATQFHWVTAWKRASGAESGSVTWNWTESTAFNEGWMARFDNVYATGTPFEWAAGTQTNGATHTAPSVNSTYSNSLWVYIGAESNYAAWSTVSGFTEHYDGGAGAFGTLQSKALSATGATGTAASTTGAGGGNAITLLLFDTTPAGGGGTTSMVPISPGGRLLANLIPNF